MRERDGQLACSGIVPYGCTWRTGRPCAWHVLETNQWRNERDGACLEHNGKRQAHCAIAFMSQPQMTNLIGHVTTQVYLTQCNTAAEGQRWWVTTLMDDHLQVQP